MRSLTFFVFVLFFAGSGFAQTLKDSASIMQVRKEPRHHDVVDNQWVRILDVHLPPGDTTYFHKHTTPSVFLVLGNTRTGSQTLIEPRHRTFDKEGIWFEDFTDTPRIHRVWNADKVPFHTIDIELPHKPSPDFRGGGLPYSELLFDAKSVRAYRVRLAPGKGIDGVLLSCPVVVIGLLDPGAAGKVNNKMFSGKGGYTFIPSGEALHIANIGKKEAQFAVFEIK